MKISLKANPDKNGKEIVYLKISCWWTYIW